MHYVIYYAYQESISEHVYIFVNVFARECQFAYTYRKLKNILNVLRHSFKSKLNKHVAAPGCLPQLSRMIHIIFNSCHYHESNISPKQTYIISCNEISLSRIIDAWVHTVSVGGILM